MDDAQKQAEQSVQVTTISVVAFRRVEQQRLNLELAEHVLWKSLRNPALNIDRYTKEMASVMAQFEARRDDLRRQGMLPKEKE